MDAETIAAHHQFNREVLQKRKHDGYLVSNSSQLVVRMIRRLRATLRLVQASAGTNFSGIGLIVSDDPEHIPVFPIRNFDAALGNADLDRLLAEISTPESEYHDGFHVISSTWKLLRVAQYFSPPIITTLAVDRSKRFGGRYLAALFGSALSGIDATGIASSDFGMAIFRNGKEVHYERAP